MENNELKPRSAKEIPALSGSHNRNGVFVRVRCLELLGPGPSRYEIFLEGHGERAVVDVSQKDAPSLRLRVDEAVGAFVDAVRIRAGVFR
jgi:hypothetical protein